MECLNLLQLYGLEISLAGTCALSYRQRYTQLQKKPISHFSWELWKQELRNENMFVPYSVAISSESFH